MKHLLWPLFVVFFVAAFGLFSCENRPSPSPFYFSVDSLIESHPDSALVLLQSIPHPESMSSSRRAEYALLLTQAMDKNYIPHVSDSLIMIAVNYYAGTDKIVQKGKSYYYLGRVCQDLDEDTSAVEAYLKALDVIGENGVTKLHAYINNNLATCYYNQDLYSRAMERYRKSYAISAKLGLGTGFFALRGLGDIYTVQNKKDSALYYYQEAYAAADFEKDLARMAKTLCDIAYLYNHYEDYEMANEYISKAISLNSGDILSSYLMKGGVLAHLNQSDSAHYYLLKSMDKDNIYAYASTNYALYQLEKSVENYKEAVRYADVYITYYDSIQYLKQRAEITKLMNDHALESHKKEVDARQQQFMLYWIIGLLAFLSSCIYLFFLFDRRKKEKLINLQQELMQNRSKMAQLQNVLAKSTSELEIERQENVHAQVALQERQKELCMRLFRATGVYKIIQDFDSARKQGKSAKEISEKDRMKVQKTIDEIYVDFIQRLQQDFPQLSQGDVYCCTLGYMGFSNFLIAYLMGVDPNVVTQRKYRIKGKMDESAFSFIFTSPVSTK